MKIEHPERNLVMANEEPKPFSSELKALRDEFKEVAERTKQAIAKLDSAIWKQ